MRRLLLIALLLAIPAISQAASRITATITVTNTPAEGDYFILNSDTRTWRTNAVTIPASEILIGAAIGAHTTNAFLQIAANPFTGPVIPRYNGTNAVDLIGQVSEAMS